MKKSLNQLLMALVLLSSCTSAKLSVPSSFSNTATRMPVSGMNGWMVNQKLSFAHYQTTRIKRGWDFTASLQYTKFTIDPAEILAKVFLDVDTDKRKNYQRHRFQYVMSDGQLETEIYATERFEERQLVYKSNNPYIGTVSKTNKYEYAFTAALLPLNLSDRSPWQLVLINRYDVANDQNRGVFSRPYVEEEGYATNGKENVAIRPVRSEKVSNGKGGETKVLGGPVLAGYELRWNGKPAAMLDILSNEIWMQNDLNAEQKQLLASMASAILLKRMQDVEKDKESFDRQ